MAGKSGRKSGNPNPGWFTPDDPRRGRGPAKGTGGRPRNEFRQKMRELASDDRILAWFEQVLLSPVNPQLRDEILLRVADLRLKIWERCADRGYGKPAQPVTVGPDDSRDAEELRQLSDAELIEQFKALRAKAARAN